MSRCVVITGASSGIGAAAAKMFRDNGDRVVAAARSPAELTGAAAGGAVDARVCDVTDETAVTALFAELDVEVLVCAAGAAMSAPLGRTSLSDWQSMLDTNATGVFLCTRAVIEAMRQRGSGRILIVASTQARAGTPYTAAYAASKHAAVGLMRAAAAELAGTGATANAVCPTFVATPMTERTVENIVRRTGRDRDAALQALADTSPLGRLLQPEEVAAALLFLASPGTSAINGQAIVLDGGGIQA